MKIKQFEDLEAWKEARKLRQMISRLTCSATVSRDQIFCRQIRAASLSVMSNIAEGFESSTDAEGASLLGYARRSCGEVRSQMYAALDDGYVSQVEFQGIRDQIIRTGKLLTGLIRSFRNASGHRAIRPYNHTTMRPSGHMTPLAS